MLPLSPPTGWTGVALGTTLYGLSYFVGHDIVAHERLGKGLSSFVKSRWPYAEECAKVAEDRLRSPLGSRFARHCHIYACGRHASSESQLACISKRVKVFYIFLKHSVLACRKSFEGIR